MDFINFDGIIAAFVLFAASIVCALTSIISGLVFTIKGKGSFAKRIFINFSILLLLFLLQIPVFYIVEPFPHYSHGILRFADKIALPFVLMAFMVTVFFTFWKEKSK